MKKFLSQITNISKLQGINKLGKMVEYENCSIHCDHYGNIQEINTPSLTYEDVKTINAENRFVTPSFVDPHTHIYIKDRAKEFAQRPIKSYEQIAKEGGGIVSSMKMCNEQSEDEIYENNILSLERFFTQGTTTIEIKSGYALNTAGELKLLRVIHRLQEAFKEELTIIPTFMGAHAFPPEYKNGREEEYVDYLIKDMIPAVANQGIAEYCDIFCEKNYFNIEQSEKILLAAQMFGMKIRMHCDEFQDSNASDLAARIGSHSADHLMAISDQGIQALAQGNVVATMLPGTTIFLGKTGFAPARKLIDAGVKLAISTDFNPGSSHYQSQPLMMQYAMNFGKISVEEAFAGVTKHAAESLDRQNLGIIETGAVADLILWNEIDSIEQIPYYSVETRHMIHGILKNGAFFHEM